ncbi:MAG: EAL domain-containing protein [Campylobacterales bacterium]|nr:EAL domain-containing protein [Campylobacterales bacterium]
MDEIGRYLEHCPAIFFKWRNEPGWPVEYVRGDVFSVLGYTAEELLRGDVRYDQLIHPEDLPRVIDEVTRASNTLEKQFWHTPYRVVTRNEEVRWVEDSTKIERDENGAILFYYGYLSDITSLERSKEELQKTLDELRKIVKESEEYRRVLDTSYIVSTADLSGKITSVNDYFLKLSGYTREEIIGKPHSILRHPSVPQEVYREMWETIQSKKTWHGTLRNRTKDGSSYFVRMTIVPILDDDGEIKQYMAVRYDMTGYVKQQEQIKQMAFRSFSTGLPNLYALVRDIEKNDKPTLAMVNIDGFKILNNLYGYKAGDRIIKEMTKRLSSELARAGYGIYHIHADEFAILADTQEGENFTQALRDFQHELHLSGLTIDEKTIPLHISIACSEEPSERLLVSCNMAMHYARSQHERFVHYDETIDFSKDYHENLRWTAILHEAINEGLIRPYFQPIYDINNNRIQKFEALIRIVKADEVFTPALFLDIAKKVKLYPEISLIMLEKTFETIQSYPYAFSINLSVEDIMCSRYTKRLFELLALPRKGGVILEIVESEGIENFDAMNRFVEKAKALGCQIAIDDFGTGYSNFEYLLKLNADYLKIDGSLIKSIDTDGDAEDIVRTIVSFAKKKDIAVIAEFVANADVLDTVRRVGIDFAQGYFVGKPSLDIVTDLPRFPSTLSGVQAMRQLVYVSRVDENLQFPDVKMILDRSWHNNREHGITGVLIYDGTYFIQCLEGESEAIERCFERIVRDPRHHDVRLISQRAIEERRFKDWNMSYIGYYVYTSIMPKYTRNDIFDPYTMEMEQLLDLLDDVHRVA